MKKILFVGALLCCMFTRAQELNALVTVNTQQVNQSNRSVFKTLEKSLQEFINQTRWTDLKVRENERIRFYFGNQQSGRQSLSGDTFSTVITPCV